MNPNEVIGTPRDVWAWLAPDWSDYQEGEAKPASGGNWTRVKIRETLYADGRIVRNVLDANGRLVAEDGTPSGGTNPARPLDSTPQYDKGQQQRWKDQKTEAGRGDQEGDTRGSQTGQTREVYRGGKWVVESNPVYQQPAETPTAKRTAREEAEIAANAALPAGQDPRSETNAERAARDDATRKQQGVDARAADALERQRKIDEQNAATAAATSRRADSAEARAIAEANKVGSKVDDLTINGQHYTKITKTSADGKTTSIEQYGPDGKPVDTLPQEGVSDYSKAPPFVYNWDDPAGEGGISAWAASVRALPGMTDKVKGEIITSQYGATNAMLARARDVISTQENTRSAGITQRGQDMGQANARLGAASADFGTSVKVAADATKYSEGPQAASVLPYYMAMARAGGQGYGGFANSPQVQGGPAIQQAQGMGIPGQGIASRLPPTLGAQPPPAAPASPAPVTPTALPSPIFRPPPPIGADPMAPPAAPGMPALGQGQDLSTPVSMAPGGTGQLSAMMMPAGQPEQQSFQPTGAGALMMQQANGYNPNSVNKLLLDAGMDPAVVQMLGGIG